MFNLTSVSKEFSGGVRAIDNVTLSISPGRSIAIIGANGAGKTTFIRLLLGLIEPSKGSIERSECWAPGSREVAAVLVGDGCFSDMTVDENFIFFGQVYGLAKTEALDAGSHLLERFGQSPLASRVFGKLSSGQKRIVTLCRALITNPTLLILDEIAANLDPFNQRAVLSFLNSYQASGQNTVVFSSHDLGHVERFGGNILIFCKGQLAYSFSSSAIEGHRCVTAAGLDHRALEIVRELPYPCFLSAPGEISAVCVHSELTMLIEALDRLGIDSRGDGVKQASLEDIYMAHGGYRNEIPSK